MTPEATQSRNRPHGPWFGLLFVGAGLFVMAVSVGAWFGVDVGRTG